MRMRIVLSGIAIAWAIHTPARAADFTSAYTHIDKLGHNGQRICKVIESQQGEDGGWTIEKCPEVAGWKVTLVDADARSRVYFGKQADKGDSIATALAEASMPFFDANDTIEWRFRDSKPFAAIQRYFGDHRQALTVHKLENDGTSCVAAVVNVVKGQDANKDSVSVTDSRIPQFHCGDPVIGIGKVTAER